MSSNSFKNVCTEDSVTVGSAGPVISGTRFLVSKLLSDLADSYSVQLLADDYRLPPGSLSAALRFLARTMEFPVALAAGESLEATISRLANFMDPADGTTISMETIERSLSLLNTLQDVLWSVSVARPDLNPCGDGSVDIHVKSANGFELLVNVPANHSENAIFYADTEDGVEFRGTISLPHGEQSTTP